MIAVLGMLAVTACFFLAVALALPWVAAYVAPLYDRYTDWVIDRTDHE